MVCKNQTNVSFEGLQNKKSTNRVNPPTTRTHVHASWWLSYCDLNTRSYAHSRHTLVRTLYGPPTPTHPRLLWLAPRCHTMHARRVFQDSASRLTRPRDSCLKVNLLPWRQVRQWKFNRLLRCRRQSFCFKGWPIFAPATLPSGSPFSISTCARARAALQTRAKEKQHSVAFMFNIFAFEEQVPPPIFLSSSAVLMFIRFNVTTNINFRDRTSGLFWWTLRPKYFFRWSQRFEMHFSLFVDF